MQKGEAQHVSAQLVSGRASGR